MQKITHYQQQTSVQPRDLGTPQRVLVENHDHTITK